MAAQAIGSGWWPGQTNDSQESQAFWMQHGEALTAIQESIKAAFAEHDALVSLSHTCHDPKP